MTPSLTTSLLAYPYQFVRTPLAVIDVTLARRLPEDSGVRRTFDRAFGTMDVIAGRLLADETLLRQGTERVAARRPGRPSTGNATPADVQAPERYAGQSAAPAAEQTTQPSRPAPSSQARAQAVKTQQHDAARGNQSLKTIQQRLVQTEAVAEAREHESEHKAEAEADSGR
jgi:hypothetical protein